MFPSATEASYFPVCPPGIPLSLIPFACQSMGQNSTPRVPVSMIDIGEVDKLVNYKAAGNSVASRHAGLYYSVQDRRSPICVPYGATAEKRHRPNKPFGLCTPINPV